MFWRTWSLLAGAPVGVLVALALGVHTAVAFAGAAAVGAALWLGVASWIARTRDDDPARPAHVACAASSGFASLGALVCAGLGLAPGPLFWGALQLAASASAFVLASRRAAPSGGPLRQVRVAAGWLAIGAFAPLWVGIALARGAGDAAAPPPAELVYDLDARVATRPLPVCDDGDLRVRVLREAGAHPRLDPLEEALWFDEADADGARQIQRLDLASGSAACITCGEAGHNERPAPGVAGILFQTDRFATAADPANVELQLLRRAAAGPSRRITRRPGADTHPLWAPGGGRVVWSRRSRAQQVVWASVQSGHGALELGPATPIAGAGAAWIAAAAWSPDARSLALLRGSPFAPLIARAWDPASDASTSLGDSVVPGGVAFSADGATVVVVSSRRDHVAGLLPAWLAAPFAPLVASIARRGALFEGTELSLGDPHGSPAPLPAAEVEAWGAPTGVALSADAERIYLGQRRADGRERLVEIRRSCS